MIQWIYYFLHISITQLNKTPKLCEVTIDRTRVGRNTLHTTRTIIYKQPPIMNTYDHKQIQTYILFCTMCKK